MPRSFGKYFVRVLTLIFISLLIQVVTTHKLQFDGKQILGANINSLVSSSPPSVPAVAGPRQMAQVTRVVDGDTVKVSIDGKVQTVRLIGVNTPETVDPRRTVQCFGKEASNFTKEKLSGQTVYLEADPTQDNLDKYKRLLRYIFLSDGSNFNKTLISEGYAYEYTYDIPYKYQKEFKQAQQMASNAKKGLWADTTCSGQE
jgi:micrococcal nuclease